MHVKLSPGIFTASGYLRSFQIRPAEQRCTCAIGSAPGGVESSGRSASYGGRAPIEAYDEAVAALPAALGAEVASEVNDEVRSFPTKEVGRLFTTINK